MRTEDSATGYLQLYAISSNWSGGCVDDVRARICSANNFSRYPGLRLSSRRRFCIVIRVNNLSVSYSKLFSSGCIFVFDLFCEGNPKPFNHEGYKRCPG